MVFVSVAKSWVKLGPIFGVLVCTVGDLTKILVKFKVFEHFFGKISHCAISKDLIPSVFDRKFLTALWIVKIWPKLNLFLGKPKVFVSVAKSYWKKGQIFRNFGTHSRRFDLNFVQIFGIFAFLNSFRVKSPRVH